MDSIVNFLYALLELQNLVTLIIGCLVFFTVVTIVVPMFEGGALHKRIKQVSSERMQMRSQQRTHLNSASHVRLREKPKGLVPQLVDALNLRKIFEAENSRERLRMAGMRSEKHLVTYLAVRLITPIAFGIIVFLYTSTVFADKVPPQMRLTASMFGVIAGFYLPNMFLTNLIQRRQDSIKLAWSDALDLLLICVESGMSVEQAMNRVAREVGSTSIPLAEEMLLTTAELSYLGDRRKAFENLAKRTGLPTVKSVVTSLIQSERYGTPLGQALRVLAQENRNDRMAEAEKKAAALPPKLTVPMVLFFLPVIFVVLLAPSIILAFGYN